MCVCDELCFYLLETTVVDAKLIIALNEFFYVAKGLVVIIAIVSVITGLMREYIPQDKLQAAITKHDKWGTLLGALFGMLTPFCSAAVVPVTMAMASMGASLGTVMSFIISAPLCNFIVLAMVYAAFGLKVTVIYFLITFTAAVLGGFLISKSPWRNEIKRAGELEDTKSKGCSDNETNTCGAIPSPTSRMRNAMAGAFSLFKRIIPYVLLGAAISGFSAAYLPADLVEEYVGGDSFYSIVVASLIGIPLYLRIEMAIPLLNVLIAKGMGAAISLIIGGTGASLPEIALVSSVLKRKAVIAFVGIVLTTAIIGGTIFQYVV